MSTIDNAKGNVGIFRPVMDIVKTKKDTEKYKKFLGMSDYNICIRDWTLDFDAQKNGIENKIMKRDVDGQDTTVLDVKFEAFALQRGSYTQYFPVQHFIHELKSLLLMLGEDNINASTVFNFIIDNSGSEMTLSTIDIITDVINITFKEYYPLYTDYHITRVNVWGGVNDDDDDDKYETHKKKNKKDKKKKKK